jgi:hypothetical protein
MKKGDSIRKTIVEKAGSTLASGFNSEEEAARFDLSKHYSFISPPMTYCQANPNGKGLLLCNKFDWEHYQDYIVNWVVGDEAGVTEVDGMGSAVININDGYKVVKEAVPTYQSAVAQMTDEELRASIESLRTRRTIVKTRTPRKKVVQEPVDPIMAQINKLPEADRMEVLKKMGLA